MLAQPNRINQNTIDPQAALHARRMVLEQGVLPSGMLRGEIEASWNRCLDLGLPIDHKLDLPALSGRDVTELQQRNVHLISSSIPEMEALYRHFGERDSVVMLSDSQATVLKSLGGDSLAEKAGRAPLTPGASWQEQVGGTNAIGTVLKYHKPIIIHGNEHYIESVNGFCCSSAPIFLPSGAIGGVLDVTTEDGLGSCHNLGLVSMSARLIENRLFIDQFRSQILVAVHSRPEFVDSLWQGLMAFGSDGQLLALDREASDCLALRPGDIAGRNFESIYGLKLAQVVDQSQRAPRSPIVLRKGGAVQLYGRLLHVPGSSSVSLPTIDSGPAKKHPRTVGNGEITLADVVMEDVGFERAAKQAAKALNHQIPLLLLGETGSGKEALARALHGQSVRSKDSFVALNCAAIPEGLIESELFGYQDGAFTGAKRGGMKGKVQQADGGILFLDEIGDMPLDMQARLLRVLQERSITPLGSSKEIAVDITVICATHRDLKQMVAEGCFREDLYYRLNGVIVAIPALRDRNNLAGFSQHLLHQMIDSSRRIGLDLKLLALFESYNWPGNVRQLQTVIKTCLAFMEDNESLITEHHLTEDFRSELLSANQHQPVATINTAVCVPSNPRTQTLKSAQIDLIKQAIEAHEGNMSAAAKSLGIGRATLYRRLQNAGITVSNGKQIHDPFETVTSNDGES